MTFSMTRNHWLPASLIALLPVALTGCFSFGVVELLILLVLLSAILIPTIIAIRNLAHQPLPPTAKAVWVLIILCVPILGSVAYYLVVGNESS